MLKYLFDGCHKQYNTDAGMHKFKVITVIVVTRLGLFEKRYEMKYAVAALRSHNGCKFWPRHYYKYVVESVSDTKQDALEDLQQFNAWR